MNELRILDLFSGIGGFSYATEKLVGGFKTVAFCEQDEFAQMVLKKHWKDIPIYEDVRTIDATRLGTIDIVCGGFPCQAVSQAGLQKGEEDERWLWDEMFRVVQDCKPKWVIGENVRGLVTIREGFLFEKVQSDLESEGYEVQSFVIPAAAVGAWHLRERVWILARRSSNTNCIDDTIGRINRDVSKVSGSGQVNTSGSGTNVRRELEPSKDGQMDSKKQYNVSNTKSKRLQRWSECTTISKEGNKISDSRSGSDKDNVSNTISQRGCSRETWREDAKDVRERSTSEKHRRGNSERRMGDLDDGLSEALFGHFSEEPKDTPRVSQNQKDRAKKLKALGNSIVPQVAAELFRAIKHSEGMHD